MDGDVRAKEEQRKYRKVYGAGVYPNKDSVGARVVPIAWGWMHGLACRTVTDWGCGHGRATRWLRSQGADQTWGIDLVRTYEMKSDEHFVLGTLWDPPERLPRTDFAFSADVLEHLPEDKVPDALSRMRDLTRIGGWLQIATIPDSRGEEVGETLHLTVRPPIWWRSQVSEFFKVMNTQVTEREVRLWITV